MKNLGYSDIDGLDSNEGMLIECEKTGAYTNLILSEIGDHPLDIADGENWWWGESNPLTLTVRGSTLVVRIWRLQMSDSDD